MEDKYGLKEFELAKLLTIFKDFKEIEKVILFGSRAKGNYKAASDIDLTLVGKNLNLTILQKLENDLDDLLFPYKFDIILFDKISSTELLEHIDQVGVEIFKGIEAPINIIENL